MVLGEPWKRTLRVRELIGERDPERIVFPGGVICELASQPQEELASRIQIIGQKGATFGLLREMFIAYSSNPQVLELSRRSSHVLQVRSVDWRKKHDAEGYSQDLLLLKRFTGDPDYVGNRVLAPVRWMDEMNLEPGDKVILSNPISDYVAPPPDMGKGSGPTRI